MSRKWGSCSTAGTVSFSTDLVGEPPGFRQYVIVHELLHLRVCNHGALFRSYLSVYVPGWQQYSELAGRGPVGPRFARRERTKR